MRKNTVAHSLFSTGKGATAIKCIEPDRIGIKMLPGGDFGGCRVRKYDARCRALCPGPEGARTMSTHLLIINPNSSQSITDGLRECLDPLKQADVELSYFTAPDQAPAAIVDTITANQTATYCYDELVRSGATGQFDGFLVCCCKCLTALTVLVSTPLITEVFTFQP